MLLGARLRGLSGRGARAAASDALAAVELSDKATRGPEELSGGEQQHLMIARTLAYAPDVYVLDEPFVGLDALAKESLMSRLRERADAGASVLVSSHELDVLGEDMHDVTLLDGGASSSTAGRRSSSRTSCRRTPSCSPCAGPRTGSCVERWETSSHVPTERRWRCASAGANRSGTCWPGWCPAPTCST